MRVHEELMLDLMCYGRSTQLITDNRDEFSIKRMPPVLNLNSYSKHNWLESQGNYDLRIEDEIIF